MCGNGLRPPKVCYVNTHRRIPHVIDVNDGTKPDPRRFACLCCPNCRGAFGARAPFTRRPDDAGPVTNCTGTQIAREGFRYSELP